MSYHPLTKYLSKLNKGQNHIVTKHRHDGVYLYNRKRCSGEWAYHFDLSGGVYRQNDILALLSHMRREEKFHPNVLEMRVNQMLKDASESTSLDEQKSLRSAIPTRPLVVILAVNRVQEQFQAPLALPNKVKINEVYDGDNTSLGRGDELDVDPSNPVSLLGLLGEDCHLDIKKYKSITFNSSHIGYFFAKCSEDSKLKEVDSSESFLASLKSVLIPVYQEPSSGCITF